jgi:hypothetical protein
VWISPVLAAQSGRGPVGELCTTTGLNRGVLWTGLASEASSPIGPPVIHSAIHRVCTKIIFVTWHTIIPLCNGMATIRSEGQHGQRPFERMRLWSSVTWL